MSAPIAALVQVVLDDLPTAAHLKSSAAMHKCLVEKKVFETEEEEEHRKRVLGQINAFVQEWSKAVTRKRCLPQEVSFVKMFTSGSYRLGVHSPGADMDMLLVAPRHIDRTEDFFGDLYNLLEKHPKVEKLRPIPDAVVPIINMLFSGIDVDLQLAPMKGLVEIKPDFDAMDDRSLLNTDEVTARGLGGPRVNMRVLECVQLRTGNADAFRLSLRFIKLWAKRRGIANNAQGFLGGIHMAIMVANVCQMVPNAAPCTVIAWCVVTTSSRRGCVVVLSLRKEQRATRVVAAGAGSSRHRSPPESFSPPPSPPAHTALSPLPSLLSSPLLSSQVLLRHD